MENVLCNYPEYFAKFYDIIYDEMRDSVDHEYYLQKIQHCKGPVLEIGAGTGRFFKRALDAGADIYAIDVNQSMIDVLTSKINENEHYRVSVQDIRNMKFNRKFELIIAPFRVFQHLINYESQMKALNQVNNYLTETGRFIFDLFVPNLQLLLNGLDRQVDFNGYYEPGKKLKRIVSMKTDLINQISYITMRFEWDDNYGKAKSEEWDLIMRYFFRYELEYLIRLSNLELANFYGDFHENELNSDSKEFILECRKKTE